MTTGQGCYGHGHGEIGLTGTGRPDAEDNIMSPYGIDVRFLIEALGCDGTFGGGDEDRVHKNRLQIHRGITAHRLDGMIDVAGVERHPLFHEGVKLIQ